MCNVNTPINTHTNIFFEERGMGWKERWSKTIIVHIHGLCLESQTVILGKTIILYNFSLLKRKEVTEGVDLFLSPSSTLGIHERTPGRFSFFSKAMSLLIDGHGCRDSYNHSLNRSFLHVWTVTHKSLVLEV